MFTFHDPGRLVDRELELKLAEKRPGDPERAWLPAYHFRMVLVGQDEEIGGIDLRVGNTEHIIMYGGHIGYGVNEEHRGHRFAARACRLLLPLARRHGLETLWITCDPDNIASRRTCELAGAELVAIVDLPPETDMYQEGERQKCRYRLRTASHPSPLTPFLETNGVLILDGGLATELERRGYDLGDELWSARLLLEAPEAIRQIHADYLAAGADCIISASYQATVPGFMRRGLRETEAIELIERAVQLAVEARDAFRAGPENRQGRLRPLVAASVGPYGAFLADGSEYLGNYGLTEEELLAFHRDRWHILAGSDTDLLACETIPSYPEARALARLLAETPSRHAWFSFTGRDGRAISDGTPLAECAAFLDNIPQVAAIGINCTSPRHVPGLIAEVREASHKPIVVYPNSGEWYDPGSKQWQGQSVPAEFGSLSREWRKAGAALIGGCCRTGPAHVQAIRDRFRV